jgi:hypothetical protein
MTTLTCPVFRSPFPYTAAPASSAVLFCSDGRLGEHIDEFMGHALRIDGFDRVAVPGGAASLAGRWATWGEEKALGKQLRFLIEAHELRRLVLVAHQECGHYLQRLGLQGQAAEQRQFADLGRAAQRLRRLAPVLQVEAFFVRHDSGRVSFDSVAV